MNRGQNITELDLVSNNAGNTVSIVLQDGVTMLAPLQKHIPSTFATLPTGQAGMVRAISDSTTVVWGANVTVGGGALYALLNHNGTNWTVIGK